MTAQKQWAVRLRRSGYGRVYCTMTAPTRREAKEKAAFLYQTSVDEIVAVSSIVRQARRVNADAAEVK